MIHPEEKNTIKTLLIEQRQQGVTLERLARETSVTVSAISQLLAGKADPGVKTWNLLQAWRNAQNKGYKNLPTQNWKLIHKVCYHAMKEKLMARIIGDTGRGKTTSLVAFASHFKANPEFTVHYLHCSDWTQLAFISAMERTLGIAPKYRADKIARLETIRETLTKQTNALLILDEASALKEGALRLLKPLFGGYHDGGFGIILAGTQTLHNIMSGAAQKQKQLFRELNNRIENDSWILQPPTTEEIKTICQLNQITDEILVQKALQGVPQHGYACVRKALNDHRFKTLNAQAAPVIPAL